MNERTYVWGLWLANLYKLSAFSIIKSVDFPDAKVSSAAPFVVVMFFPLHL